MADSLSNNWNDVHLLKLDPTPGSEGPFAVVQEAVDANDPSQKVRFWMLRRDGQWVDLAVQSILPAEQRRLTWFDNIREVMALLGSLPTHPAILHHPMTDQERAAALGTLKEFNLETIRELVRRWKEAHENA
jgi:hypothetical protein